MTFTSFEFLVFFATFFLLYWLVFGANRRWQNTFLLLGSYAFYASWDWRFLWLVIGLSAVTFFIGIRINRATDLERRRMLVTSGILAGLAGLFLFKYYDFFAAAFLRALGAFGFHADLPTLNLILPLGISFYSFRIVSYVIDVYRGKTTATNDWVAFFCYVAFFPCLIAGPIDRAGTFLPQLEKKRAFDREAAADGMRQILWGVFKKIAVADNCSPIQTYIFDNYKTLPASSLALGLLIFTVQIYADFSGYSDIAIGVSRLLGFSVSRNFDFPFFSRNIAEFWQKWHISLTSWMTDYVFSPLNIAFRDWGKAGLIGAILINFVAVGFWHGANWTFISYGFLQGCLFVPLILSGSAFKKRKPLAGFFPSFGEWYRMLFTFTIVVLGIVFFRTDTVSNGFDYLARLVSPSLFTAPATNAKKIPFSGLGASVVVLFATEWLNRLKAHGLQFDTSRSPWTRRTVYALLLAMLFFFGRFGETEFIYKQF